MTDFDKNDEAKTDKARRETCERKSYAAPTLEKRGQLARLAAGTATSAPAVL